MTRDLVAAAVLLHMLATGLQALPSAGAGLDRRRWQHPTVQAELEGWRTRLGALGIERSKDAFEEDLYAIAVGVEDAREILLTPFLPYLRSSGSWQSWKMFVAPHRHPSRLVIAVDQGNGWQEVYRRGDSEHDWSAGMLDHDRMRSVQFRLAWTGYNRHLRRLAGALAARLRAEDPTIERVRVGYERRPTPRPEALREGQVPLWTPHRTVVVTFDGDTPRPGTIR